MRARTFSFESARALCIVKEQRPTTKKKRKNASTSGLVAGVSRNIPKAAAAQSGVRDLFIRHLLAELVFLCPTLFIRLSDAALFAKTFYFGGAPLAISPGSSLIDLCRVLFGRPCSESLHLFNRSSIDENHGSISIVQRARTKHFQVVLASLLSVSNITSLNSTS